MRAAILSCLMLAPLAGGCVAVSETRLAPLSAQDGAMRCDIGQPMVETHLFMGLSKPGGGAVTRFEFNRFVETEIVPRWKEGFTILDGNGVWLSQARNLPEREASRVLIRIHDGGKAASDGIEEIRAAYIKTFSQEAVLRTDRPVCADF